MLVQIVLEEVIRTKYLSWSSSSLPGHVTECSILGWKPLKVGRRSTCIIAVHWQIWQHSALCNIVQTLYVSWVCLSASLSVISPGPSHRKVQLECEFDISNTIMSSLFSPIPTELAVVSQIFSQADPEMTGVLTGDISQRNIGMSLPRTPSPTPFPPLTAQDKARFHRMFIASNHMDSLMSGSCFFFLCTLGAYSCLN